MKRLTVLLLFIPLLAAGLTGCVAVPVLFIAAGGVGAYAISKDTIQGDTDTSYEALWDSAKVVARIRGTILREDFNRGYIEVDATPSKIWIQFVRLTTATTKIKVSARKYKLPNIELAQEVFVKIIEESKKAK